MFRKLCASLLFVASIALFAVGPACASAAGGGIRVIASGGERPIELRSLSVQTEIAGTLAKTTVDMVFFNPNGRVLIGELHFPLQKGQTVTGFALEMEDGELREATAVDKARGREAFEEVTRMQIDPALLEVTKGNSFKMRVYPLNPASTRRVRVAYTESLAQAGGENAVKYALPLRHDVPVKNFALEIGVVGAGAAPRLVGGEIGGLAFQRAGSRYVASTKRTDHSLVRPVEIAFPLPDTAVAVTGVHRGQRYFYAEVPVGDILSRAHPREKPKIVSILWDASLSGEERDHSAELALLEAYFQKLSDVEVRLQVVRDVAEPIRTFTVKGGNWLALRTALGSIVYDGATNLGALHIGDGSDIYLLFSDGLDNYSAQPFRSPRRISPHAVKRPSSQKEAPLFALTSSPGADYAKLQALANAAGGFALDISGGGERIARALSALSSEKPLLVHIAADGARDFVYGSPEIGDRTVAVAGALDASQARETTVTFVFQVPDGKEMSFRDVKFRIGANTAQSSLAPQMWASMKLMKYESDRHLNRAAIARLGKAFGMATGETSLIVLDRVEDYVRYEIEPPHHLRAKYDALLQQQRAAMDMGGVDKVERVLKQWQERIDWWNADQPKGSMPPPPPPRPVTAFGTEIEFPAPSSSPQYTAVPRMADDAPELDLYMPPLPVREQVTRIEASLELPAQDERADRTTVSRRPAPYTLRERLYLDRLKHAESEDLYRIYLDERPNYRSRAAFYENVAELLEGRGMTDLSLRVLSNLAEIDLENRENFRALGYRLMALGRPEIAVTVFRDVLRVAEEEPTSWRDLGLAYAAAGNAQQAVDTLYEVVLRSFPRAFEGIEMVVLAEINEIVARASASLDTSRIDARFLKQMPVGLRAVLSWNSDNSVVYLHVVDPNGQDAAYVYGHRQTYQGGRVSGYGEGYGPVEFVLRDPKPGKYRVAVSYVVDRRQTQAELPVAAVSIFRGYGSDAQKVETVVVRFDRQDSNVVIGEFEIE